MSAEFVHLHVHTQYSMLDGAIKVKDLVKRVAASGMRAVAVTDHGNMFGAISFYKAAKDAGVQSILGSELDVAVDASGRTFHLPLLAANLAGYKNLISLVSSAHLRPPVSLDDVAGRTKGLVALTGCMGGIVAQRILEEGEDAGARMLERLAASFEPGNLYVELQDHGLHEQPVLNGVLVGLAKRMGLPIVATNDVHFAEEEDADAHLYLSCIKTGRALGEAKERHHGSREMYLKSPDAMARLFSAHPEAIRATVEIAEKCQVKLKLGEPMLPSFKVPEGFDTEGYFRHVAREGLQTRFADLEATGRSIDREIYQSRLAMEMDVICKMKFPGYFLIVWDFIRYAKESGIPVGPGRGSGAGSLVAYAMSITDLDPIPYGLLFERFLNPERVSMPDFDIDFCVDRRDQVIAYVQQKYGESSVGQIATFAELKAKSVIKDVARAMGITPVEAQNIANLIPRKTPAETYTIAESLEVEPKLKARFDTEPKIKELLTQAQKLEGLTRHAGKHAAGVVISEGPLWDHVPVFKDDKSDALITQYYKEDVEQAGLVKFDFLGLKTLTVLEIAVHLINKRPDYLESGRTFDLAKIPLDDKPTYALIATGETKGVFQLEGAGMQQLFKDLRADSFEDIIAAVALYRPGPLGAGMVGNFVNRKHGREAVAKMHPLVDDILVPTYGVVVYQEQVMQIAQKLAGYTLGAADLLRRAMGKKKPEEMAKQKSIFVDGAKNNGVDEKEAEHLFGLLEYFAGYGFNKSHSAAYALVTYQTAYLKAHYPVELLCAILSSDKERIDKIVRTVADARAMGVTVLPPDINESDTDFRVVYTRKKDGAKAKRGQPVTATGDPCGPQIRFGLGAVRGVGGAALETLFEARKSGGAFVDLFDFAGRVDAKKINKSVLEALVQCGAFDSTLLAENSANALPRNIARARAFASIDLALERSRAASRDREVGQTNLFGSFVKASVAVSASAAAYADAAPWDRKEMLARERQSLGFYVSGHPLERYLRGNAVLARLEAHPIRDCATMQDWSVVRVCGMVEGYREKIFQGGGGKIAFLELEDLTGRINVKVRGNQIDTYARVLTSGEPVLITGKVTFPRTDDAADDEQDAPREPTVFLNEATLLSDAVKTDARAMVVRLHARKTSKTDLAEMDAAIRNVRGECPVHLHVVMDDGAEAVFLLGKSHRVEVSDVLLASLERIFGEEVAEFR